MLPESDISKIREFSCRHGDIAAVYVFGSVAAGRERKASDIDLGLLLRSDMDPMERVRWETSLSNLLHRDVDLVLFHECSPLLQHQILTYGCLLYQGDAAERIRQETFARRNYLDSAALYRKLARESAAYGH